MNAVPSEGSRFLVKSLFEAAGKVAYPISSSITTTMQGMGGLMGLPTNDSTMNSQGTAIQVTAGWVDRIAAQIYEACKVMKKTHIDVHDIEHLNKGALISIIKLGISTGQFAPDARMGLAVAVAALGLDAGLLIAGGGLVAAGGPVLAVLAALGLIIDAVGVASAETQALPMIYDAMRGPAHALKPTRPTPPIRPRNTAAALQFVNRMSRELPQKQFYFYKLDPRKPQIWYNGGF